MDSARGLPPIITAVISTNISSPGKANSANSKHLQRWQMTDFRRPFRNHFPLQLVHKKKTKQKKQQIKRHDSCYLTQAVISTERDMLTRQVNCHSLTVNPETFFAWNTNCVQCHPKGLLFRGSPTTIQSLNYLSYLTKDYLRAVVVSCHMLADPVG